MEKADVKSTNFRAKQNQISSVTKFKLLFQWGRMEDVVHFNQEGQNPPENLNLYVPTGPYLPLVSTWALSINTPANWAN